MKVSICCITYNHEKFLKQAFDGFLLQEFDDYEIVVSDDFSTDRTQEVLKEYEKKYPNKIRLLLNNQNVGVIPNFIQAIMACNGDYIALCEGDDFWTDSQKLQMQVNILEQHPEYSMVFSNRMIVNMNGEKIGESNYLNEVYSLKDVINGFIPATQTIVFKKNIALADFFSFHQGIYSGDRYLSYFCAQFGNIYRVSKVTAAYRDSGLGVWSKYTPIEQLRLREKHLYDFHDSIGLRIDDPQFAIKSFENFIELIIIGVKKPSIFFEKNFNKAIGDIWKKYKYLNRLKLLRIVLMSKIKRKLKLSSNR